MNLGFYGFWSFHDGNHVSMPVHQCTSLTPSANFCEKIKGPFADVKPGQKWIKNWMSDVIQSFNGWPCKIPSGNLLHSYWTWPLKYCNEFSHWLNIVMFNSYINVYQRIMRVCVCAAIPMQRVWNVCPSVFTSEGIPTLLLMREKRVEARADGADLEVVALTLWNVMLEIPSGNQTRLAGTAPINGVFNRKTTDNGSFFIAMFDYRRV